MLRWLYTYVASIYSQCFIVFSDVCYKLFIWMLHMLHTYVANVISGCCVCLQWFSSVFASVLDTYFKCFISSLYVANVASECFKSRSRCCTYDACGKREETRAVPTHGLAVWPRYWGAHSQVRRCWVLVRSPRRHRPMLVSRIGRLGASKSATFFLLYSVLP